MNESAAQKRYLRRRLQNRRLIRVMRILILVLFSCIMGAERPSGMD